MPSKVIHFELTMTALSLGPWNHVSRIAGYVLQYIGDPDTEGMQDSYIVHDNGGIESGIVPHHEMREIAEAFQSYYYWNSVCYYLMGDYEKAGETLARALHYAQDSMFAYSEHDPLQDVEGEINKILATEKDSIIREALYKYAQQQQQEEVELFPKPTSKPKQYLIRSLYITYYLLKQFEKDINLAQSLTPDEIEKRLVRTLKLTRVTLILFLLSLPFVIINYYITIFGIVVSMGIFAISVKSQLFKGAQPSEFTNLLWALGYQSSRQADLRTVIVKIRGKRVTVTLQPYVKPCRS